MSDERFPPGWDESRVRRVLEYYESQSDEEAVAEDEAAYESTTHTSMVVPSQLFVDAEVGVEAVDFFLQSGRQKPSLHWVRSDGFSRETVWVGRQGREAWRRANWSINRWSRRSVLRGGGRG